MLSIVYFKSIDNKAYPSAIEEFKSAEDTMIAARTNNRSEDKNTFLVFDNSGKCLYESDMVPEYYININDYI